MVVVPTSHDVRLTYGETTGDRAGRVLTLVGLLGIIALARVRSAPESPAPEPEIPEPGMPEAEIPPPKRDEDAGVAGRPDEVPALP
jgi:hypothetical protein